MRFARDRLFLIAYDEIRDCPALDPYRLTCGLVGAQLAELVIAGLLTVREDRCVLDTGKRPGNLSRGATLTLDNITREPRRHPVRAWVDTLGPSVTELVCEELVCCNVLTVIHRRSLLGRRQACLAVADPSAVRKPGIILRTMLRQRRRSPLKVRYYFFCSQRWARSSYSNRRWTGMPSGRSLRKRVSI